MNNFSTLNAEQVESRLAQVATHEDDYTQAEFEADERARLAHEGGEDAHLDAAYEARTEIEEQPYEGGGWPGDGSGTDDLADYNQNEANDYMGE